jgi:hypothetical protein
VELAAADRLGAGGDERAVGADGAGSGEESALDGAVGDGEQPRASTTRESAATARPINRPYVASKPIFTRAPERPSGSQDVAGSNWDCDAVTAIVTACALQEPFSSYVSVSAEHSSINRHAPSSAPAAGVFCWRGDLRLQA